VFYKKAGESVENYAKRLTSLCADGILTLMLLVQRLIAALPFLAASAFAHEYPLQFTPAAGGRNLVVAGYQITGSTVIGNCSYDIVTSGSGKGGGYHTTTTHYYQTCTWDLSGKLLSVVSGAPVAPPPLYTTGTRTVYAVSGAITSGTDSALSPDHGFVDAPGSHFTWGAFTPPPGPLAQNITLKLTSDGDMALNISEVTEATAVARSHMTSTTCVGTLAVGSTCSIVIFYNPLLLTSPSGLAYETLTVTVQSDSPQSPQFVSQFTIRVWVGSGDN
jgi:hypothetical protein